MAREDRVVIAFDELAVGLSSGTLSRGKALKLMGAALVGSALASIPGIAGAAPKPKPAGKKCKSDSQCLSGVCVSGVCGGIFGCHRCPETCACAVSEGGTIECISCPNGPCVFTPASSCAGCGDDVCVPAFGGGFLCAPPCTAG